ncbi:rhodanese domain-containing protein CG4456-like [Lucilia cuprina]|uniref:rhodanese domain-containing protein CG4456-like n=1 Tax=Lucilia cuprina TaxID=7375 RepID=UPI001F059C16|nr:rhodanese domain-containing protein CG4456-like [Lucilia cuprina]
MRSFLIGCLVICAVFQIAVAGNENGDFATYEEVKDIPNHPEKFLIEVRSKELVDKDGSIPGSINIPFTELEEALMMDDGEFASKYGAEKPPKDAVVIFTCLGGQYAQMGADLAKKNGWQRAKPYLGSWLEWSKREGLQ